MEPHRKAWEMKNLVVWHQPSVLLPVAGLHTDCRRAAREGGGGGILGRPCKVLHLAGHSPLMQSWTNPSLLRATVFSSIKWLLWFFSLRSPVYPTGRTEKSEVSSRRRDWLTAPVFSSTWSRARERLLASREPHVASAPKRQLFTGVCTLGATLT